MLRFSNIMASGTRSANVKHVTEMLSGMVLSAGAETSAPASAAEPAAAMRPRETGAPSAASKSRPQHLVYMDALNYSTRFFQLDDPTNIRAGAAAVDAFVRAARASAIELHVFLDANFI